MKYIVVVLSLLFSLLGYGQELDFYPISKGELITHTYYKLSYLEEHEQPEWVAYYLSPEMLHKVYDRKDAFGSDTSVSTGSATYEDYKAAPGFDAGHLLPCRQMQFDCEAMAETFYMSNMSPQVSSFNRNKWAFLEKLERNMAWRNNGIYVVTGPVLSDIDTAIGISTKISVPKFYYKVFLSYHEENMKAIAFLLPNRKDPISLEDYVVSIDFLEAFTGIDFFPALEDSLENSLEKESVKALWSFKNPNDRYGYDEPAIKCSALTSSPTPNSTQPLININTASKNELESLPGIGSSKADAIISMRPFASIEEITKVSGIGTETLRKIEPLITVEE
ncbi:MAG: DNA/RNA endonuclease [Crocinitomicaceae bacterium]|nr:DNA/RNA endonuclease [Crocinitomicaceae bacterium]|tara:strand:- start:932 stop:1936 length:1005 start_codon:yes stop_codon:yes gene_type:complete